MKKIVFIAFVILLIVSCDLRIKDSDGFNLWNFNDLLDTDTYVIQSHDGFVIDEVFYHETTKNPPICIENRLNRAIEVRIWDSRDGFRWIEIPPYDFVLFELMRRHKRGF